MGVVLMFICVLWFCLFWFFCGCMVVWFGVCFVNCGVDWFGVLAVSIVGYWLFFDLDEV